MFNCGSLYIINVCPFVLAECRLCSHDITPFVSSVVILNRLPAPKVPQLMLFGLGSS